MTSESLKAARLIATHTRFEWEALCAEFDGRCVRCGDKPDALTRDHIVACVHGGSNGIDNIQPLCSPCNQRKGHYDNTDYVSYRRRHGFEVEDHRVVFLRPRTEVKP